MVRVMAHLTVSVEYATHCLLWLVGREHQPLSSRDLATLQGISPSFVAKIFPKLEKAGLIVSSEGIRGGYRLARAPQDITFLDIVDAVEGNKPLFDCQNIRSRCAVFDGSAPAWATRGVCAIHAVMLNAEKAMRAELAASTLADVAATLERKAPPTFATALEDWIEQRTETRNPKRGQTRHEQKA